MAIRKRVAVLLGAAAVAAPLAVPPAVAPAPAYSGDSIAVAAHACSRGTHAVMPDGSHKCLARGQYCKRTRSWNRVYHRKGFHCGKQDRNGRYHLTYW